MTAAADAQIIRSLYDAYSALDIPAIDALLADNYAMHVSGQHPLSGDHRGKPAVWAYLGKVAEVSAGQGGFDVHSITTDGDGHAVALLTGTIRDFVRPVIHVFHLRDGLITEFWDAYPDAQAEDEFWRSGAG
jgi:ketosteroid isomerase-like protein